MKEGLALAHTHTPSTPNGCTVERAPVMTLEGGLDYGGGGFMMNVLSPTEGPLLALPRPLNGSSLA